MNCPTDESESPPIGMSSELEDKTIFTPLDKYYKFFSYDFEPDITKANRTLEITGKPVRYWRSEEIMELFISLDVFC